MNDISTNTVQPLVGARRRKMLAITAVLSLISPVIAVSGAFMGVQSAAAQELALHAASVMPTSARIVLHVSNFNGDLASLETITVQYKNSKEGAVEENIASDLFTDGAFLVVPVSGLTPETAESFIITAYSKTGVIAGPTTLSLTTAPADADPISAANALAASIAEAASYPDVNTMRMGPIVSRVLNRRWFYLNLPDKYAYKIADIQVQRGSRWVTITTAVLKDYAIQKASTRAKIPTGAKLRVVVDGTVVKTMTA